MKCFAISHIVNMLVIMLSHNNNLDGQKLAKYIIEVEVKHGVLGKWSRPRNAWHHSEWSEEQASHLCKTCLCGRPVKPIWKRYISLVKMIIATIVISTPQQIMIKIFFYGKSKRNKEERTYNAMTVSWWIMKMMKIMD